jgi:hypothetical protein
MCAINRSSIYILLGILVNLSALTFELVFAIFKGGKSLNKKLLNATSTVVPFVLAAVGFALEGNVTCATHTHCFIFLTFACIVCVFAFPGEIGEGANGKLNTARHAFSCSMRYEMLIIDL